MRYTKQISKQAQGQLLIEYILVSIAVVVVVIAFIFMKGKGSYREALNENLNAVGKMMDVKHRQIRE